MKFLSNDSGAAILVPVTGEERVQIVAVIADLTLAAAGDAVFLALSMAGSKVWEGAVLSQDSVGSLAACLGGQKTVPMQSVVSVVTGAVTHFVQTTLNMELPNCTWCSDVTVSCPQAANMRVAYETMEMGA